MSLDPPTAEGATARRVVVDAAGEVLSDDGAPRDAEQIGEEAAELFEGIGELFRKGGRVVAKAGRMLKRLEPAVGPLERPIDQGVKR